MHPIERLRYVARAAGDGSALLAQEAAGALAAFVDDPAGLVTACRRLVDRHPTSGPMWWLAARVLCSGDPGTEAWRSARALDDDATPLALGHELPDDPVVTVLGWPELTAEGLRRRGDARALVVDALGEGSGLVRRLAGAGLDARLVEESGLGAAAAASTHVVLEASALGPDGLVAVAGSRAAAAVARHAGVPVWVTAGVGRALPGRLWQALVERMLAAEDPWEAAEELVPLDLVDRVVGERDEVDCPVAPELLRGLGG